MITASKYGPMRNNLLLFLLVVVINMATTWCFMGGYITKTAAYAIYLLAILILLFAGWRFYKLLSKLDGQ
jgi:hypothetical protein